MSKASAVSGIRKITAGNADSLYTDGFLTQMAPTYGGLGILTPMNIMTEGSAQSSATKKRIIVSQQSGESSVMVPARTIIGPDGRTIVQNRKNQVIYSTA